MVLVIAVRTAPARRPGCSCRWSSPAAPARCSCSTGSPVNVIVSEAADEAGSRRLPVLRVRLGRGADSSSARWPSACCSAPRVLPDRTSRSADRATSAGTPSRARRLLRLADGFYRLRVRPGSPVVGIPADALDLTAYPGVTLIGVQGVARPAGDRHARGRRRRASSSSAAAATRSAASCRRAAPCRGDAPDHGRSPSGIMNREVGRRRGGRAATLAPGRRDGLPRPMRARGTSSCSASAAWAGTPAPKPVELTAGDSPAASRHLDRHRRARPRPRRRCSSTRPDLVRRQAVPLGPRSGRAVVVLLAWWCSSRQASCRRPSQGSLAATAMVLTRCSRPSTRPTAPCRGRRWCSSAASSRCRPPSSRAAPPTSSPQGLVDVVGSGRPYLLLVALFVLTAVVGQVVSNTATVLIVVPIAVAAAQDAGVSVPPVLMLVAVAGSASLLTPDRDPRPT